MSHAGDMLSLFNSWLKKTRLTEDKLHILCPEAAVGDTKKDLHQDAIAFLATNRFSLRKFVVACFKAE